jgi:hypothetical protein
MPRTFEAPEPTPEVGQELRQFFTDLLDDTNLREYHANTEAYVRAQMQAGVVGDVAANLILLGRLQDIEDNIKLVKGSGGAVPVCIVFPPF